MKEIINSTIEALKSIRQARFFQTERSYQGKLYCELYKELDARGIIIGDVLLEMEYQKSSRHELNRNQRPDIILHIPAELHSAPVHEGNFAVYALKHQASANKAKEDFDKLDDLFENLRYPLGFFINIDSTQHRLNEYTGHYRDRLHAFAVTLVKGEVLTIIHASWIGGEIRMEQF
jgi:hypothetical protein